LIGGANRAAELRRREHPRIAKGRDQEYGGGQTHYIYSTIPAISSVNSV
jgi:hypothetical protein